MAARNIIFRAPLTSKSGYGVHARQLAAWLLELEKQRNDINITFDLIRWGTNPCYSEGQSCEGLIGKILASTAKRESYDVSFQLQLPHEWDPGLADTNVGLTAAVETDRCNPGWVDAVNAMDLVIVPSEFTRSVLDCSGTVRSRMEVVPESWIPACADAGRQDNSMDEKIRLETGFNFLVVSQFAGSNPMNDRKNIAFTLKWIMEEFQDCLDTGIIIKTNFGGANIDADRRQVHETVNRLVSAYRKGPAPKVYILHGYMNDRDLVDVYTHPRVRAMVSLTRGEAFGLPILEAATCGLPVIVTDWSGHTEYLVQGEYIGIDYTLDKIHPSGVDNFIFMKDARWANPSKEDFRKKIRFFYEQPEKVMERAAELRNILLVSHSPRAIHEKYSKALQDII